MQIIDDIQSLLLSLLNKDDRKESLTQSIVKALSVWLTSLQDKIFNTYCNFFFDTLTSDGCQFFENLLKVETEKNKSLENRRAKIQAKWLSNNHNSIALIQKVCNAWKNGEVVADFKNGKYTITFIGSYGVPDDIESLKIAIGEVKLAHINFEIIYKHLLIEDIHEVKTIEEMETITLDQFANGME